MQIQYYRLEKIINLATQQLDLAETARSDKSLTATERNKIVLRTMKMNEIINLAIEAQEQTVE